MCPAQRLSINFILNILIFCNTFVNVTIEKFLGGFLLQSVVKRKYG